MSVIVCQKSLLHFFIEYMKTFQCSIRTFEDDYETLPGIEEIIYVQTFDLMKLDRIRIPVSILNTEQLSAPFRLNNFLDQLRMYPNFHRIYDYSTANQDILSKHGYESILKLYLPQSDENRYLRSLLATTPVTYHLAFIGCLSPRRLHILDQLRQKGLKIWISDNTYGDERDQHVAQCAALLNIHYDESYQIFESIRCVRWIYAGMKVFSEKSIDYAGIPYEELVDTIVPAIGSIELEHKIPDA